jgi:hypothetical protein
MQLHVDPHTAELINRADSDDDVTDVIVRNIGGLESAEIVRINGRVRIIATLSEYLHWMSIRRDYAYALERIRKELSYMAIIQFCT